MRHAPQRGMHCAALQQNQCLCSLPQTKGLVDLHGLPAWVVWLGLEEGDPGERDTGHLQRLLAWKVLVLVTVAVKRRSLKCAPAQESCVVEERQTLPHDPRARALLHGGTPPCSDHLHRVVAALAGTPASLVCTLNDLCNDSRLVAAFL